MFPLSGSLSSLSYLCTQGHIDSGHLSSVHGRNRFHETSCIKYKRSMNISTFLFDHIPVIYFWLGKRYKNLILQIRNSFKVDILYFIFFYISKCSKIKDIIPALRDVVIYNFRDHFWKCNFPMNHNVSMSVRLSFRLSVGPNFLNVKVNVAFDFFSRKKILYG